MKHEITLVNAFDIWMVDCSSRNLSKQTIIYYRFATQKFIEYLEIVNLSDLKPSHIRQYLVYLRDRGLTSRSQHDYARAIRTYCNFCVAEGLIEVSPFKNVKMPKMEKKILPAFSTSDIKRILKACINERDRTIVLVLLDSGVRVSEFISLNIGDVEDGTVKVRAGKGNKSRYVYLGNKSKRQLAKYPSLQRDKASADEPLFTTNKGGRFTIDGFQMLMKRLKTRSKVEHTSAHTFRRTFCVNCLRSGMNIYVLAKLMGHTDITVLRQYLYLVEDDLQKAHSEHSPVDNIF